MSFENRKRIRQYVGGIVMERDKYGNYVNEKGVIIKVNTDKKGKDHVNFYDGPVDGDHGAVHVDIDYENKSWHSNTHDKGHNNTNNSSGGCYLTTACVNHLQEKFDDNCSELTLLRWFRDNYVPKEDVKYYYLVSPIIVKHIESMPNKTFIYQEIYENTIIPSLKAIKQGYYNLAYDIYKNGVLNLKDKYCDSKIM